jgi:hypothetical protein
MSFTPVVIVAVYEVEAASDDVGSNVAVFPLRDTVPGILVVPTLRVKVDVLTLGVWTDSLNVAAIDEATGNPVAALGGLVLATVGGVVSADAESVVIVSFWLFDSVFVYG